MTEDAPVRRDATAELSRHDRRLRQYSLITLLLLAGGLVVNVSTDNDTAKLVAMLPAMIGLATLVWTMHHRLKARSRYLQEQSDANTSNTSESTTTSERTEREE